MATPVDEGRVSSPGVATDTTRESTKDALGELIDSSTQRYFFVILRHFSSFINATVFHCKFHYSSQSESFPAEQIRRDQIVILNRI